MHFAVLIATSALVLSLLPFLYFSLHLWWQSKTAPKAVNARNPGHDIHNQPDTSEPPVQAGGLDTVPLQCDVIIMSFLQWLSRMQFSMFIMASAHALYCYHHGACLTSRRVTLGVYTPAHSLCGMHPTLVQDSCTHHQSSVRPKH